MLFDNKIESLKPTTGQRLKEQKGKKTGKMSRNAGILSDHHLKSPLMQVFRALFVWFGQVFLTWNFRKRILMGGRNPVALVGPGAQVDHFTPLGAKRAGGIFLSVNRVFSTMGARYDFRHTFLKRRFGGISRKKRRPRGRESPVGGIGGVISPARLRGRGS